MKLNSKTKKSARDLGDPDPGHGPVFGGFLLRNERSSVIDDFLAVSSKTV